MALKKRLFLGEPDIEYATELMRFVCENRIEAAAVAKKGREDIVTNCIQRS